MGFKEAMTIAALQETQDRNQDPDMHALLWDVVRLRSTCSMSPNSSDAGGAIRPLTRDPEDPVRKAEG